MLLILTPIILLGFAFNLFFLGGTGLSAEPEKVEQFVKARIEIGEMMTDYFSGGRGYGGGRPSPDQMRDMREDINAKLRQLLGKHGLTLEEYTRESSGIFADNATVQDFLSQHPDLKKRYEALPFDRMGTGGRSGRGY